MIYEKEEDEKVRGKNRYFLNFEKKKNNNYPSRGRIVCYLGKELFDT